MSSTPSVVLLTGHGLEHRYVTGVLGSRLGDRLKAVVLPEPALESSWARLKRVRKRYSTQQLLSRIRAHAWRRAHRMDQRLLAALKTTLFQDDSGQNPGTAPVRLVRSHNHEECVGLLHDLKPDIVAIYGTALIRKPTIETAGMMALNLHTGISPRYRGADSPFWALHNEEPEWIGSTVHVLDAGVDSGAIFGVVRPEISADDDEASLYAKCVRVGGDLYAREILAVLEGRSIPMPQDLDSGREYRFVDRTVAAEERVQRLLADGLIQRYAAPK